jgi:UDP-glucose 4-epimerase
VPESANALVTGGAGFMGSHVVDALLQQSEATLDQIVVLDDLSGGCVDNVSKDPRVEFVRGSVTDERLIDEIFAKYRFKYVYHLAAYAAEGLSHFIRRFNYSNNLLGSVNLINAAVRHETACFVFTSSIAVYGEGKSPLSEHVSPRPVDPYGISKYAVELDLEAARQLFGLRYVIFRPHNVYGERQHLGDMYRNVVGIFMNRLLRGLPMPVFGDGTQQRAFTYIDDVAPLIARAPWVEGAANQIFNLGSDEAYSINELAGHVAEAMELPATTECFPARHEVHVAYCTHEKIAQAFSDIRRTPLHEGLRRMADWAKQTSIRPGQRFNPLELDKNLPVVWRQST